MIKKDDLLDKFTDAVIHSDNDAKEEIEALRETIEQLENE